MDQVLTGVGVTASVMIAVSAVFFRVWSPEDRSGRRRIFTGSHDSAGPEEGAGRGEYFTLLNPLKY
ncbi:hypothetical protein A4G26_27990 [Mycobacterium kansasii]|nr:hypothetical protein A4G26_27990 [Mycobacterium kansasii]